MGKDLVPADEARENEYHNVIKYHLEGRNATWIARSTGLLRKDVTKYVEEFKRVAKNDDLLRERAQEVVHEFDGQQSRVISAMWDVAEDAEEKGDLKTRATVLKSISDVTAKRVEVLQKSGLLSDAALGDEMAEIEEKQEKLVAILREVTAHCNKCKIEVARRLSDVTGKAEPIQVVDVQ